LSERLAGHSICDEHYRDGDQYGKWPFETTFHAEIIILGRQHGLQIYGDSSPKKHGRISVPLPETWVLAGICR